MPKLYENGYNPEVLNFIKEYFKETMLFPSIRKICKETGLSSSATVKRQLDNMVRDGAINKVEEDGYRTHYALQVVDVKMLMGDSK